MGQNTRLFGYKKLVGGDKEYRIRAGKYRILYEIDDNSKQVFIFRIAPRDQVYRK
jgi:mRNA interferase RelE/StbE